MFLSNKPAWGSLEPGAKEVEGDIYASGRYKILTGQALQLGFYNIFFQKQGGSQQHLKWLKW